MFPVFSGVEQKSPINTNMVGMASLPSKPSKIIFKRESVVGLSSHTSLTTTNMSLVLTASDSTNRFTSAGRNLPAPKKSQCADALADSSRASPGGNPNALADTKKSKRQSSRDSCE
jgi:hypothetical protein|tara:strand:- start:6111 stop:6458 length:348 start_codon:yes stop_codon:yes gene_type:complete